jgi:hypothetical protein
MEPFTPTPLRESFLKLAGLRTFLQDLSLYPDFRRICNTRRYMMGI